MDETRVAPYLRQDVDDFGSAASRPPLTVQFACALMLVVAILLLFFGLPAVLTGLFVGPHILVPALVCLVLGFALLISRRGLSSRKKWQKPVLLLTSFFVVIGVPALLIRDMVNGEKIPTEAWGSLVFPIVFLVISLLAFAGSTTRWLDESSG